MTRPNENSLNVPSPAPNPISLVNLLLRFQGIGGNIIKEFLPLGAPIVSLETKVEALREKLFKEKKSWNLKMRKLNAMILVVMVVAMTFSFVTSGMQATTQQRPKIKIGALGPLGITPGKDMERGVKLAVEEINKDGFAVGSTTYDFEVIVESSSAQTGLDDAATGGTALTKLTTSDNVTAIIGGFRTEVVVALQLNPNFNGTPFLGVGSTAPIVSPNFWRVGPTNGTQLARALIELEALFLASQGFKNITVVREDASWSLRISTVLKGTFATTFVSKNVT
ncbi:MAG TPA: ABC transporter substrate-binding protein, partial [Candidatus Hodarchaeales archaeon]|nr:ABC transporter substrate-binding protein [Candidatus Hodarchaeales archaeon]